MASASHDAKRVRLDEESAKPSRIIASLIRDISPPARERKSPVPVAPKRDDAPQQNTTLVVPSPFQLTRIEALAAKANIDTISLDDILGDPELIECYNFNYLFDLDFVMNAVHRNVRNDVKMNIVHGSWKKDDNNRLGLEEARRGWSNVNLITAYMPEPFGTHHCKMMVLFYQDNRAQIVVHTANMITRDWAHMTQAVWRSPLLPLEKVAAATSSTEAGSPAIGSGARFKQDLVEYLKSYGNRLVELQALLADFDFSPIRASFISSSPGRHASDTTFGWPGLQKILSHIDCEEGSTSLKPNLVLQVSSIASLGQTNKWLNGFITVLSTSRVVGFQHWQKPLNLPTRIIFPSSPEIRASLAGYASGASIHTKLSSSMHQKQLAYIHPMLHHWGYTCGETATGSPTPERDGGRDNVAPHVKTYFRFKSPAKQLIDWGMLTSANLSTQAWGATQSSDGNVRIASYETGVVVWPALWGANATMVPTFGRDTPDITEDKPEASTEESMVTEHSKSVAIEPATAPTSISSPAQTKFSSLDSGSAPSGQATSVSAVSPLPEAVLPVEQPSTIKAAKPKIVVRLPKATDVVRSQDPEKEAVQASSEEKPASTVDAWKSFGRSVAQHDAAAIARRAERIANSPHKDTLPEFDTVYKKTVPGSRLGQRRVVESHEIVYGRVMSGEKEEEKAATGQKSM